VSERPIKMRFEIPPEDRRDVVAEWLWVIHKYRDEFTVDSIPFDVFGISADDVVCGSLIDGNLVFEKIKEKSGNRTIRIKLKEGNHERFIKLISDANIPHVEFEGSKSGVFPMYAINIRPNVDIERLKRFLDDQESKGYIEYEEADF